MKTLSAVIAVAVLCAVSSAAVDFDRADPAAGVLPLLKSQALSMPTPASSAAVPAAAAIAAPWSLKGDAVGNDVVDSNFIAPLSIDATLVVNNDGDRVGAKASIDDGYTNSVFNDSPDHRTQLITYVFSGLRYDKAKKQVLLGDEVVGRNRGLLRGGLRLDKGYAFETKVVERRNDLGFDRDSVKVLEVSIVRK